MTFDEWWTEVQEECVRQGRGKLLLPIKELAALAWAGGSVEGYNRTRKQIYKERNGDDAKAGSKAI
jgi:hypothetical protein